MSGKEFVKQMCMCFFVTVTLVTVAIFVVGSIYQPDRTFGYEAFLAPLIYGICGTIPVAIMYSKRELSMKALVIRKVLQLLAIEIILNLIVFDVKHMRAEDIGIHVSFSVSILVVYIMVHVILWLLDVRKAKQLTDELHEYQEQFEDNGLSL